MMLFTYKIPKIIWVSLLCISVVIFPLISHSLTVEEVPNPRQINQGWVTDMADLLSDSTEAKLNQRISQLEATNGAEIAIVTVPETQPSATPKAFTTELFNDWGIGKQNLNNGVLFLISQGDRRVEIETGSGMGEILPDTKVAQIINTEITPQFKQGNFDQGVLNGTNALIISIEPSLKENFSLSKSQQKIIGFFLLICFIVVNKLIIFKRQRIAFLERVIEPKIFNLWDQILNRLSLTKTSKTKTTLTDRKIKKIDSLSDSFLYTLSIYLWIIVYIMSPSQTYLFFIIPLISWFSWGCKSINERRLMGTKTIQYWFQSLLFMVILGGFVIPVLLFMFYLAMMIICFIGIIIFYSIDEHLEFKKERLLVSGVISIMFVLCFIITLLTVSINISDPDTSGYALSLSLVVFSFPYHFLPYHLVKWESGSSGGASSSSSSSSSSSYGYGSYGGYSGGSSSGGGGSFGGGSSDGGGAGGDW